MRNILILLCLAGLAACGSILTDRQRLNVVNTGQNWRNDIGIGRLYAMTRDELLLQKFILDVLRDVEQPLRDENLLSLRVEGIADRNNYIEPLDSDMLLVLDLILSNRVLGRNDVYSLTDEVIVRQQFGLHRLLVRCRDIQTLQRLVIYARQNVNPILFVNSLISALQNRLDTQQLIIPAIYEILPKTYNVEGNIRMGETLRRPVGGVGRNQNVNSLRQRLLDVATTSDEVLLSDDLDVRSVLDVLIGQLIVEQGKQRNSIGNENLVSRRREDIYGNNRNRLGSRDNLLDNQSPLLDVNARNIGDHQGLRNNLNRVDSNIGDLLRQRSTQNLDDRRSINQFNIGDLQRQRSTQNLDEGRRLNQVLPLSLINDGRPLDVGNTLSLLKRRLVESEENTNTHQRLPRSVLEQNILNTRQIQIDQLLLHQLQQLVARLNIEQISLQNIGNLQNIQNLDTIIIQDDRLDEQSKTFLRQQLQVINQRLEHTLQQVIQHLQQKQIHQQQRGLDNQRILQEINQLILNEILHEVISLSHYSQDGPVSNILENPITEILLRQIVITLDGQIQKLLDKRNVDDILYNDVSINNLRVDELKTIVEEVRIGKQSGRLLQLNHKPFSLTLDVNSKRPQDVVIRTLLVPKVDALGNQLSLEKQRLNTILLDIAQVKLNTGRNVLQRNSRSIVSVDQGNVTPLLKIYQRVMGVLQGNNDLAIEPIVGQTILLPQRLLLPRGRVNGLPIQLLVVITPANDNIQINVNREVHSTLGGLESLLLDNLPLIYPLDRDIINIRKITNLPNVLIKDLLIYHDDQVRRNN